MQGLMRIVKQPCCLSSVWAMDDVIIIKAGDDAQSPVSQYTCAAQECIIDVGTQIMHRVDD